MGIIISNALLCDIDPINVEAGELRLDGGTIVARGPSVERMDDDVVIDAGGCVVLPGMVNGHTHLYSALAAGMPGCRETPANFYEILRFVWWRLDRALDAESVLLSAEIGALDALRCGTTTLIDHHASPSMIDGSLDLIQDGLSSVGVRGVLCYETTDRNGRGGREAGLKENCRYLARCAEAADGRFAALVGAHASFTCDNDTMEALAALAREFDAGVHIHVAEDSADEQFCRRDHGIGLIDRLEKFGMLHNQTVIAHAIHLAPEAVARVNATGMAVCHNARSNMNNAVGYAPLGLLTAPVQLGTDGIGADMFAEARAAWFKSRDAHAGLGPAAIVAMLANAARRASTALGVELGRLQPGARADIVLTDYLPSTPLHTGNLAGHLLFAIDAGHVRSVLMDGEFVYTHRVYTRLDVGEVRARAREATTRLWNRMDHLAPMP